MSTEDRLESGREDEETSEEEVDEEASSSGGSGVAEDAAKRQFSVERWVQISFLVFAIGLIWVMDHVINAIWYIFADPNDAVVTALAVVTSLGAAIALYQNKPLYSFVHGVSEEMSNVSWPTRKETSSSTVVVVVTSLIAAVMLFLFDSVWSAVTDLVYKV